MELRVPPADLFLVQRVLSVHSSVLTKQPSADLSAFPLPRLSSMTPVHSLPVSPHGWQHCGQHPALSSKVSSFTFCM